MCVCVCVCVCVNGYVCGHIGVVSGETTNHTGILFRTILRTKCLKSKPKKIHEIKTSPNAQEQASLQ